MTSIPKFHSKAVKEAETRFRAARDERERAQSFLDQLDDVLDEPAAAAG